ncbi:MAG: FAD-dependent oxidoreductase [Leucobacter sp.]
MILIIGSGVAGLAAALAAADAGADVELVTPGKLSASGSDSLAGGNTALAQGGIAVALAESDSWQEHLADTVAAGAQLVDREAGAVLVQEGTARMRELLAGGLPVDRDAVGRPLVGLEAAHGVPRILHAGGDRSGAALHAHLAARVLAEAAVGRISVRSSLTAVSLLSDGGAVSGAVLRSADGALSVRRADAVLLATGGYAALYPRTSNHSGATGSGIVLAAQIGAVVADLEFVQFHPTVLHGTGSLVSEAVRGAGAVLRDGSGQRFMTDRHPRAELAPRDFVSREIHRTLRERGEEHVWLDATTIEEREGSGTLARRFPGITAAVQQLGHDWTREPVPVSPAAHYTMGGIASDLDGRSSEPGLFVAGEVASTGVHGANRLASNSLLEGLVFGHRAGRAAAAFTAKTHRDWTTRGSGFRSLQERATEHRIQIATLPESVDPSEATQAGTSADNVSAVLASGLGIERDAAGLHSAITDLDGAAGPRAALASMIARAALGRTESRGAHQRLDHPETDRVQAQRTAQRFVCSDASVGVTQPHDQRSLTAC